MEGKERIIVALDVDSVDKAISLIEELSPYVGCFKIGPVLLKPLLHQYKWEEFIEMATKMKISLFIDEKLCHSPEVLKNTIRYYNFPPIKMFTIQASCGRDSLRAAVSQKGITIPKGMKILVSTVLTSMSLEESQHVYGKWPKEKVVEFAFDALETGCDGIVCSSRELGALAKYKELDKLEEYVPGIRPDWWSKTTDQKRIDTPRGAIEAGADYLIIGRPILYPPPEIGNSVEAVKKIIKEIETVKEVKQDA
jgi:orotidine-5'-phosphate decarboxylase